MKKVYQKIMKEVLIKRHNLDHVFANNKVLYNTNNHPYSDEQKAPPDYDDKILATSTCKWIDLFHENNYKSLTFDEHDMKWLTKALLVGSQTGRFSHIFDDELDSICKKYEHAVPKSEEGWFIRSDRVSLKEGMHGAGPYKDLRSIIQSMVTTKPGHFCFELEDKTCTIYFMKWQNINPDKEFRVFVFNNEITAVSVQHLYSINNYFNTLSDQEITKVVNNILDFFSTNIRNKLMFLENYTFDFAFVEPDDKPYFIEPNGFGRYYAAGSALYHWIYDHDTLHENDVIEFRYVNEY